MTTPLTLETFDEFLQQLDDQEFVAFVADLWREGGWETTIEGTDIVATREASPETRRLTVRTDDRGPIARLLTRPDVPDPGESDAVVLAYRSTEESPAVIDVEDLYDRLLFALDREACRELCRRHFDRAVDPVPDKNDGSFALPVPHRVRSALEDRGRRNRMMVSVVVLLAIVGIAVVAGAPFGSPSAPIRSDVPGGADVPTPVGGEVSPAGESTPTERVPTPTPTRTPVTLTVDVTVELEWIDSDRVGVRRTCNRSPQEVIEAFLGAARFDAANRSERIRTMWQFADPRSRPPLSEFDEAVAELRREYPLVFSFRSAFFVDEPVERLVYSRGDLIRSSVAQTVLFVGEDSSQRIVFVLEKLETGDHRGCWVIRNLYPTPESSPAEGDRNRVRSEFDRGTTPSSENRSISIIGNGTRES